MEYKSHYCTNVLGLAKYYYHKITRLEIGRACGKHGEIRNIHKILVGKSEKKTDHHQDLDVHRIILKEVLGRTNRLLSFDTTRTAQKTTRPTIRSLLVYLLPR
jgi:hypothetical protein